MTRSILDALREVLPRTLEGTAFLFAEESPEPLDFPEGAMGVSLRYEGRGTGALRLWASRPFVAVFAANMLGMDESDPDAVRRGADALGELLNISIGHCLTEAWGEEEAGRIGIPQALTESDLDPDLDHEGQWYSVEGHPLWVGVRTEVPA